MTKPVPDAASPADLTARAYIDLHEPIDRQLSPLGMRAIEALAPAAGEAVLDIGCGTGQSALQLAERVGPRGQVIGIDIAARVLEVAEHRAAGLGHVRFILADAQRIDLPERSADAIFSRFGVMAFADPIAAFANFRRILKPSGRLAFVCWRGFDENELDYMPVRAAGLEAMVDATPFGFADGERLHQILDAAGFEEIMLSASDERVSSGGSEAMAAVLLNVGALGKILRDNPDLRGDAEPRLRAALADREIAGMVALNAATWVVTACPRR